ncbi:MAG: hypothetical protein MZU79_06470, partial [Anaerotruncus sp.]|nr:hypothetical protein [Anaerotruncus sp.]
LLPKLAPGGCFAVHNVLSLGYMKGVRDFLEQVRALGFMETTDRDVLGRRHLAQLPARRTAA